MYFQDPPSSSTAINKRFQLSELNWKIKFHLLTKPWILSAMIRLCEVPIVAPELRREESLLQIADAFQQLDAVASEILGRVNKRVSVPQGGGVLP